MLNKLVFVLLIALALPVSAAWSPSEISDLGPKTWATSVKTTGGSVDLDLAVVPGRCIVHEGGTQSFPILLVRAPDSFSNTDVQISIDSVSLPTVKLSSSSTKAFGIKALPPFEDLFKRGQSLTLSNGNGQSVTVQLSNTFRSYQGLVSRCAREWSRMLVVDGQNNFRAMTMKDSETLFSGPQKDYWFLSYNSSGEPHHLIIDTSEVLFVVQVDDDDYTFSSDNDYASYASCNSHIKAQYVTNVGSDPLPIVPEGSTIMTTTNKRVGVVEKRIHSVYEDEEFWNVYFKISPLSDFLSAPGIKLCPADSDQCRFLTKMDGFAPKLRELYAPCKQKEMEANIQTAYNTMGRVYRNHLPGETIYQDYVRKTERLLNRYGARNFPELNKLIGNFWEFDSGQFYHPKIGNFYYDDCMERSGYSDNKAALRFATYCNTAVAERSAELGFEAAFRRSKDNAEDSARFLASMGGGFWSGITNSLVSSAASHYGGQKGISQRQIDSVVDQVIPTGLEAENVRAINNLSASSISSNQGAGSSAEEFLSTSNYACTTEQEEQFAQYLQQANASDSQDLCVATTNAKESFTKVLPYFQQCLPEDYPEFKKVVDDMEVRRQMVCANP